MTQARLSLTELARAGFQDLDGANDGLARYAEAFATDPSAAASVFADAADPDAALARLLTLAERAPDAVSAFVAETGRARRLANVLGASSGLAEFLLRHPDELAALERPVTSLPSAAELDAELTGSVAGLFGEEGWTALRIRYRRHLLRLASFDLEQDDPVAGLDVVAAQLADLAGAALEASLACARTQLSSGGPGSFPPAQLAATRLSVIGMGKCGARELNYVSDVDVIFVAEAVPLPGSVDPEAEAAPFTDARAVEIATRLAQLTMRGADSLAVEPGLWEVDANLRPEGKDGALVRTLDSHLAYYQRWAKSWEFQALLKARPIAGDRELGERYVAALAPMVWSTSAREGFVESVQRMRERVTAHIPADEMDVQLKLGPGGLRDIEFTVQLLQLVHGHVDPLVRQRDTLSALAALAAQGYIGREESARFALDYRTLRVLEHRTQLARLTRTHLFPRDEAAQRALARGSRLAGNAAELVERWTGVKRSVRSLHERLFYRPLLSAVASLSSEEFQLTSAQAEARLAAIGFRDPRGALAHIAALTGGVSRAATIQRTLLPVMLQWFADGADPDYGLLTFRRLSEDLGSTHWFLKLLRDSSGAAERLTRVLSGSRFVGELLGRIPEAVAWLDSDEELHPRPMATLRDEAAAVLRRHEDPEAAAAALRQLRRREILRLALAGNVGVIGVEQLGPALSAVMQTVLGGALELARRGAAPDFEMAIIAMGRFGGAELGFGSDADVMYVFRAPDGAAALPTAQRIVADIARFTQDPQLPLELDLDLRPEGKNGPVARSLDAYAAYYARWSLTWEAQALLRARGVAGDEPLIADFTAMADRVRYPQAIEEAAVREVRRIKARVENERLPQGADPARHLKLGRGSLSDVEWFVQLEQLQHAAAVPALRTTSTLTALQACLDAGLIDETDAARLRAAWILASRARSAVTLWTNRTSDLLPTDRAQLEGIARLMEYPPGSATRLEEDYLAVTRRARAVFERRFYGMPEQPSFRRR